ncbi:citryl-CoA lyase [Caenimonas soli]|uniref:citryl-CoA lyase n=1 Tax=Caenimonas soli TaxID=2735555 RepID=UPI001555D905|nr:citryl-CoA lyase [Caenimonas soli]NPC55266.1 citryl-CoA lyase [Caenimonas soli]
MAVKTEIGTTTASDITVRGRSLSGEILGKYDFVDMICWLSWGRMPTPQQKNMLNLLLVAAADHGLTPSALSARLTFMGAPESLQGAVAAGLLGAGSTFLGTVQNAAELLSHAAGELESDPSEQALEHAAARIITRLRDEKKSLPGWGHPIHVNGDPRVPVLIEVSSANGYLGRHWRLALAIERQVSELRGRKLPLNAAGAFGAIVADMGLDPMFGRGIALVARAAGLVAHVLEERRNPIGPDLWNLVLSEDPLNELPAAVARRQ